MERTKMLPAGKAGGAYIPPFRLKQMQAQIEDKTSAEYQRMTWEALKKSINGLVNKVTKPNISVIVGEIFQENLIRGRGLYCRSIMKAQLASPAFTPIYAALTAVINTKLPENGETLLKRVIMQFRRSYKRNDKPVCTAMVKFVAHLINQQVCHEILGLQLLTVLLEKPTDDSVELAVSFVKEAGSALQQLSPQGLHAIFERFRGVLHEGSIDKRVQYMIEGLFAVRKTNFAEFPALDPDLDLVDADDQITHELSLEDQLDPEAALDIFHVDAQFAEHEEQWASLKREILGEEEGEEEEDGDDEEEEEEEETEAEMLEKQEIQDQTETDLVNLRRTIYLTIQSSMQSDEAAHKLLKLQTQPGQEKEMLRMIIECGMQEKVHVLI
jgi:pre-mRNA-splicing factor CWC22